MNYPISKKIFIKRKNIPGLPGLSEDMRTRKIGATIYKGTQPLTSEEKAKYMPQLLGISSTSDRFEQAVIDYLRNISVPVPALGLELEIGFNYESAEARQEKDEAKGAPINVADYVLYRHCLVYSRVANSFRDVNKSNNIEFYIEDPSANAEAKDKANRLLLSAMNHLPEILNDSLKVKQIVSVANEQISQAVIAPLTNSVDVMTPVDLSTRLFELAKVAPEALVAIIKDKTLEIKYLLSKAVEVGVITRIANTSTLVFASKTGDITLGNNLSEAISVLKQDKNSSMFTEIKAKLITRNISKDIESIDLNPVAVQTPPREVADKPVTAKGNGIKLPPTKT